MVGVRPAAKRQADACRFAPANFARAASAKPLGTAKIKSALRQRGIFILLYVTWGIEPRDWGSTRGKKAGGCMPVCASKFCKGGGSQAPHGTAKIKSALRQRGIFILLYVTWGIEPRDWGSTRGKKAGGCMPVCASKFCKGGGSQAPHGTAKIKSALRQRGIFILLYVTWGIEPRDWGSTRGKKAGGCMPVCASKFCKGGGSQAPHGTAKIKSALRQRGIFILLYVNFLCAARGIYLLDCHASLRLLAMTMRGSNEFIWRMLSCDGRVCNQIYTARHIRDAPRPSIHAGVNFCYTPSGATGHRNVHLPNQ